MVVGFFMQSHPVKHINTFLDYLKFQKRYARHTITSYENDLTSARSKMWAIANNLLKNDSQHNETTNYIFTNSLNKVSLISPYNFFGLNYHHTICELQIDYVTRYNK